MDFNIANHLKRKRVPQDPSINIILELLTPYVPDISSSQVDFRKGRLVLRGLNPQARTYIRMNDAKIMKEATEQGVLVHGIL